MLAYQTSSLFLLFTISTWVNCYVHTVNAQSADNPTSYSPNFDVATRSSPESNASLSCQPGLGEESHHVVNVSGDIWPYQAYNSSPHNPPELEITTNGEPLAPGLLFITPDATKDTAPLIMTDTGQLVWNGPSTSANNLRVATYEGNSILTYWSGLSAPGGHGYGNVTFLDSTYNEILNVCPQFGLVTPGNVTYPCQADLHESFITDRNTLLVTAYNATETDLSSIGGPSNGWVFDCLFFELDPKSGGILFRWSALEHVPVGETKVELTGREGFNQSVPFDWFHINSVVNIGNYYLVNSRHLWTTYLITAKGDIEWTLQGDTGGDFGTLPTNGHFSWQHFARPHNITETSIVISYFNNFNAQGIDNGTHPSNALALRLTIPPNKSSPPVLVDYLSDPNDSIYSGSQGSTTYLPNGDIFVGYGEIAVMKEFRPIGSNSSNVRWTARFGLGNLVQNYRAYKTKWQGFPTTSPNLFLGDVGNGCRAGYVSWNGATNVEEWVIYEGKQPNNLSYTGRIGYKGFETQFIVQYLCVQVAAKVNGEISARSSVVCTSSKQTRHD